MKDRTPHTELTCIRTSGEQTHVHATSPNTANIMVLPRFRIRFKAAILLAIAAFISTGLSPASALQKPVHPRSNNYQQPLGPYKYHRLPSLRQQAVLQDSWTSERHARIPALMRRLGVDAWLLTMREHAEDTMFWPLKGARQFAARRRTTVLFLAAPADGDSDGHTSAGETEGRGGEEGTAGRERWEYTWVDNTPVLWDELRAVLDQHQPRRIAVNADRDVAFASGLHVGELAVMQERLGSEWTDRFVVEPMLAVEYVGRSVPGRLEWYQRMMETAWAMIAEAFSEAVVVPGVTTTEVSFRFQVVCRLL